MHHASRRPVGPLQVVGFFFATLVFLLVTCSPAQAADSAGPDSLSDAFHYELVGIARADGISYASLIDRLTGKHYLLSTHTKSGLDVELSSVHTDEDPLGPSAILRKGGTSVLLKSESMTAQSSDEGLPTALIIPPIPKRGASASSAAASSPKPPPGATLPLVFQEVDPRKMILTDEQRSILDQLRQDFINDVNAPGAEGASKAVGASQNISSQISTTQNSVSVDQQLQNWRSAQDKSDALFRMLYGTQAFNAYTESSSYPTQP